ncbi:MAG: hypothetical protein WA960_10400 [Tunicatimonas sp.]
MEPYATAEVEGYTYLRSRVDFQVAVEELKTHAAQRAAAVASYLTD